MFNDFGVQLKIPKDRLCPPVSVWLAGRSYAQRHRCQIGWFRYLVAFFWVIDRDFSVNYILWIEDVVTAHASLLRRPTTDIIGLDMFVYSPRLFEGSSHLCAAVQVPRRFILSLHAK